MKGAGTGTDYDGTLIRLQGVTAAPDASLLSGTTESFAQTYIARKQRHQSWVASPATTYHGRRRHMDVLAGDEG